MTGARVFFFIKLGFLFLGIVFLGIGSGLARNRSKKQRLCTQTVSAVIVDVIQESTYSSMDHSRSETWYPVYEYTAGSEKLTVRSHVGGLKSAYRIGQKTVLQINPDDPKQFYDPNDEMRLMTIVFCVVGCLLFLAGLAVWMLEKHFL